MNLKISILMWLFASSLTYAQKIEITHKKIDSIFQDQLQQKNVHNAFLTVYSDKLGINWNYAEGSFKDGSPVSEHNPFLSTSITKTFTATIIMLLQEEGELHVNDSLSEYLNSDIINGLHEYKGVDYSNEILIKQLLQHTSGLPDYFEDVPNEGPEFMELLFNYPEKMWQPLETINFAKSKLSAHFPPGKGYHYSDTEYVLLGLIIEEITGKPLHEVFTDRFFIPLNMHNTYMHLRSKPLNKSIGKLSEVYVADTEISTYKSLSADWAGGGFATTSKDLLKFYKALNERKVVNQKSLNQMQRWVKESFGLEYGFGLRKFQLNKLNPLLGNITLIGHSGTSGAFMYYAPELDVYLTGTFNQTDYHKKHVVFMMEVLANLKNLQKGTNNEK
ncbi:beta-lactamase family protein [Aurantibacter crassamenti]|uniref:serine hydrolase domain-containing protein n=1 Tax=Aurantibacter crassamenti TaxID=1837375 RepID=UPI00193A5280|nr:serine hydrolase domain-containing protein [Aurantibacter crassamenti]MBM1106553.1 beta-lactamase family protein [Aurantibacter crassamenti]